MRKKVALLFLVSFITLGLFAQNKVVKGVVLTKEEGTPLSGATVSVKGSKVATATGVDGKFSFSVPANATTLTVGFVGYLNQDVKISSGDIRVALEQDSRDLGEVVVVGYGTGKKVGSVVGSVEVVSGKVVQDRPLANAFDALQGRVAGLQVYTSSGEPSQTSSVRLHGVGSLGASSTPLYLLDGIPVDGGTIVSLNPNDIESISVLKDASSTSIYGSRAANGVIYITSKKGKAGRPAEIRVSTQYGLSNLANENFFNQFMNTKELTDYWIETGFRSQAQVNALLAQYPFDTRWHKTYYRNNQPTTQTDVSISGGAGKTGYYISASYFNQQGLAFRSGFKRYTLRSNLNTQVNDWFSMGLNLYLGSDDRETNQYGANSTNRGLSLLAPPFYSPNDPSTNKRYEFIPGWGRYHPEYLEEKLPGFANNVQFNPTGYLQFTPIKNLTIKTQAGLDAYDYRASSKQLPSYIASPNNGNASESFTRGVTKTFTNTAEYKFNISNLHNFTALIGTEYIDNTTTDFFGSSTGQSDDRLMLLGAGPNNRNAGSGLSEYAFTSKFSRLEYNFDSKYFVDLSIREDASSRFGKDNRTANFWSVGGMWKAIKEDFFARSKWLTDLTFNASVGTSGNSSIGNYQSQALVGTNLFDGGNGWVVSTPGNSGLAWETQQTATLGVDLSIKNRLRLDVEYYIRNTKNMLISVPYPFTSGFSSITSNVGTLSNRGVDFELEFDLFKNTSKKAFVTLTTNFNYNKNEVTELFQGKQYWIIPNTGVSWAVGQPVSYFYPVFYRVNPENGFPEWFKPNADPNQIVTSRQDPKDVTSTFSPAALQQNTGIERYPRLNGGFGLSAGYKGFSLQADFAYSSGKYMINNDRYFFENPNQFPGFNQSRVIMNYWKRPGDIARFPKYGIQFTQFDSRLVEDASFLRLKTLSIGYDVPKNVLDDLKVVKGAKFFLISRNLFTWTKYSGPDPEVDSNIGLGTNPNTRQSTVGIELKF